ncbi:MAG: hypothetical protein H7326_00140 [Bdellovibrionaceae bacterium]|nr:hypothetical protein [Pseudobdellovibrionaceae bacterium]
MISKKNSARAFLIFALVLALLLALFMQRRTSSIEKAVQEIDELENGESASPPLVPTVAPAKPEANLSPETQKRMVILDELLSSRDDNDPRIDQEFKFLNGESKIALRAKYDSLPAEKRNERGLIVFLLGRNLKDAADFQFFKSVVEEPACQSLADCSQAPAASFNRDEEDHAAGQGAALAYPQLVAIKSVQRILDKKNQFAPELVSASLDVLKSAQSSSAAEVRAAATQIQDRQ